MPPLAMVGEHEVVHEVEVVFDVRVLLDVDEALVLVCPGTQGGVEVLESVGRTGLDLRVAHGRLASQGILVVAPGGGVEAASDQLVHLSIYYIIDL